jgi:hypothetical protein
VCFVVEADVLEHGQPRSAARAKQPFSEEGVLLCSRGPPEHGTCANGIGYGGHISGCSSISVGGVASCCMDVYDGARSLASGVMIVTLDVTVCSDCLGADSAPHLLWGVDGDTGRRVESGGPPGGDLEASRRGRGERWDGREQGYVRPLLHGCIRAWGLFFPCAKKLGGEIGSSRDAFFQSFQSDEKVHMLIFNF